MSMRTSGCPWQITWHETCFHGCDGLFLTVCNNFLWGILMKKNFGTGRKPTSDTDQISQSRRKLLMGCAWLPAAPLLAMLGGCNDSDNAISDADAPSTFEPPASTAEISPPIPAPDGLRIPLPPFSAPGIQACLHPSRNSADNRTPATLRRPVYQRLPHRRLPLRLLMHRRPMHQHLSLRLSGRSLPGRGKSGYTILTFIRSG